MRQGRPKTEIVPRSMLIKLVLSNNYACSVTRDGASVPYFNYFKHSNPKFFKGKTNIREKLEMHSERTTFSRKYRKGKQLKN